LFTKLTSLDNIKVRKGNKIKTKAVIKMNEIQKAYKEAQNAYNKAVVNKDWDLAETLEDAFLDAEEALIQWTFEQIEKLGKAEADEIAFLKKHWAEKADQICELAMRLKV
jgi:6-pyruvoyl-tetrahydropterin synthase